MDHLTESDRTFLEAFATVAKRPYLGYVAGAALFFVGSALYASGIENDQPDRVAIFTSSIKHPAEQTATILV